MVRLRLLEAINYDSVKDKISKENFDYILDNYDPTVNKEYSTWLVQQCIKDEDKFFRFVPKNIRNFLTIYDKIKRKKNFPIDKKNIFNFSIEEFRLFMLTDASSALQKSEEEEALKNSTVIFKDKKGIFVHPKTKEASVYFGRNFDPKVKTEYDYMWCTANPRQGSHYHSYVSSGDLFIYRPIINENLGTDGSYQLYIPDPNKNPQSHKDIEFNDYRNERRDLINFYTFIEPHKNEKLVKFIIEKVQTIEDRNKWGALLVLASEVGNLDLVKQAIEKVDINYKGGEPLTVASSRGHLEIVKFLLEKGADANSNNDYPLQLASNNGNLEIVKLLLNYGAEAGADDSYALKLASESGHAEVIKLLLAAGADVHVGDDYPLRIAVKFSHLDAVKVLLDNKADVHARDEHALVQAIQLDNKKMINLLIEYGADPSTERIQSIMRFMRNTESE
jgi:ankyrin repeat protein